MTRPSRSLNWYDPGASGIVPAGGRWNVTAPFSSRPGTSAKRKQTRTSGVYPDDNAGLVSGDISAPGPTTPRMGDQAVPADREPELLSRGDPDMLRLQAPLTERYT